MWVDRLIISIGRVPFIAALDAPVVGLKLDERGFVEVDAENRTNLPRVWAIGDLVKGPMLAHKAEEEGVAVAERIAGRKAVTHIERVPSVVYTEPEIAWVGKTEDELKNAGRCLPVHGQRPRQSCRRNPRLCEDAGRRRDRPGFGTAYHRTSGRRADCARL